MVYLDRQHRDVLVVQRRKRAGVGVNVLALWLIL